MNQIATEIINFVLRIKVAFADDLPPFFIVNPLGDVDTLQEVIEKVINLLLYIGGPIAVVMYLVSGFQFLTAGGDDKKIKSAKQTILWTTVGLVILILSNGIVYLIRDVLTGGTL